MRKTIYTTILLFFLVYSGTAQPQYLYNNYAGVDSSFIYSQGSTTSIVEIDFSLTGENYMWDFSDIEIVSQQEEFFITPNQSGYFESFMFTCVASGGGYISCFSQWNSISNLALKSNQELYLVATEISDYTEFQKKSSTKVESTMIGVTVQTGESSVPYTIPFSEPDIIMKFPISFENADSSISGFSIDLSPFGYDLIAKRWQKRVNHVDGWGSLITPYTSFPQTLRMFSTIEVIDSVIYQSDTIAIPRTELLIQWFSPLFGQPVFKVHGVSTEVGNIFNSADFIDTLRCLNANAGFLYFPPAPLIDAVERTIDISFINTSLNASHYAWDFGDPESGSSNNSDQKNPIHTFSNGGNYIVTLAVKNEICEPFSYDTLSLPVFIADTAEVTAAYTFNPEICCLGSETSFTSQSVNSYNFLWDFGDGTYSTDKNPNHTFSEPGIYLVNLTASNTTKSDEVTHNITVYPVTSAIAGVDSTITRGDTIELEGSGGDYLSVYQWDESEYLDCTQCPNPSAFPEHTTTFYLTLSDVCNVSRDSVTITVTPPISVNVTLAESQIKVFPNPTEGTINIAFLKNKIGPIQVEIVNTLGQKVWSSLYNNNSQKIITISFENRIPGAYILYVKAGNEIYSSKLLVK
jgi:PKD repeat protein